MNIYNSQIEDIDRIFELYEIATNFQNKKSMVAWPKFKRELVQKEISENRQWKLIIDQQIACVWATTDSDPQIWGAKNEAPSIYIHRISTNPNFRGRNLVKEIVTWSKKYAQGRNKKYIRMDTVGENIGLITHYKKCGFDFIGLSKLQHTSELPLHYQNATVSLFQLAV
ncbi:GNAT family N-acetyltransferase [Flavobacteriaceae bacterium]|nr:GNAT family N-acetyltransferase [Flavobacteriaceae bacterium]MDB4025514.1 GNAT family N-acetyltransferase [Flavobacteriaceae bacterium]